MPCFAFIDCDTVKSSLARLGCRCDGPDKRDMDEPEAADEVAARFLQTIDRKGTPAAARQLLRQLGLWELSTEAMLPMLRQRVPIDFSEELLEDARLLNEAPPPDEDEAARRDLTGLLSLAIDDPSTLEVDDAVSIEVLEGGKQRLWVHIADPTRYITAGSSLDVEAQRRLSSIYVPSGVVPMLPLSISAGLLSLRPGVEACGPDEPAYSRPHFHVGDPSGCGMSDPDFPFYDPRHGVYHLFFQYPIARPGGRGSG